MITKPCAVALFLMAFLTAAAFAQSSDVYARSSGDPIEVTMKTPSQFSGSIGTMFSRSSGPSIFGGGLGLGGSVGGTLVKDKVWFFATGEQTRPQFSTSTAQNIHLDSKMTAQIGDRNTLNALFAPQSTSFQTGVPSSFLSLHYTGIITSNSFVTATVSQTKR